MEIFKHIAPLKAFLRDIRRQRETVGLVPTMGALHKGHLQLIEASKKENAVTVATIYINPTQFNNPEDLANYPRTLEQDTGLLQGVQCDVLFCPDDTEMYSRKPGVGLDFGQLEKVMEGRFRPGHFSGVGVVVSKLFNIIQPDRAYFGQKDWQQFAIIKKLVDDLKFNVELRSVPTLREPDGLAMSSRNQRLSGKQRAKALIFYKALKAGHDGLLSGKSVGEIKNDIKNLFDSEPEVKLEYFEVADSENLNLLNNVSESGKPILCIAGYVGEVRLIDNLFFRSP